ncbi:MAG TPA: hypothetical protein DCX06_09310 [Opitutae bacterium]|nr:hypothetical protein [Opitutae bacterium]
MRNECQAGFEEFLNLWQSSESLRLLIRQAVASDPSVSRDTSSSYKEEEIHPIITKAFSKQNKVFESLIAQGTLSPSMLTEKLSLSYGGLSRKELLVLLNKFKAGKRSLGTYMLVRAWKRHSSAKSCLADVRLKQLTLDCFSRAITENRSDFFNDIADTLRFLQNEEYQDEGQWNHDPGQWWQFNLLLYILEYPKEKYAMREFVSYFTDEVGSNEMPTTKTIRKFCRSQGIALDSSPGAPKKKKQSS